MENNTTLMQSVMNAINTPTENESMFAPTKGLGFHQFDGKTPIKDVLQQIGANFSVRKDSLVRLPQSLLEAVLRGESVNIDPKYLIRSHSATVREEDDKTISVVGADYGVIQNNTGFDILDLLTNSSVTNTQMSVVSAGLVHDFEPYVQVKMGEGCRLDGDNSDTDFYCFFHNSHDGGSAMRITFSTIRVVCQNTFMMNCRAEGLTYKHTKYVGKRTDLNDPDIIHAIQAKVRDLNLLREDYIQRMNSYRLAKVTDKDIDRFIANIFFDDKKMLEEAQRHDYNLAEIEMSTRMSNIIGAFKDTLESGVGQDTNRGTKLWLYNGLTNYLSNTANYGSAKDDEVTKATKRFDALMEGKANSRMVNAYAMLAA